MRSDIQGSERLTPHNNYKFSRCRTKPVADKIDDNDDALLLLSEIVKLVVIDWILSAVRRMRIK